MVGTIEGDWGVLAVFWVTALILIAAIPPLQEANLTLVQTDDKVQDKGHFHVFFEDGGAGGDAVSHRSHREVSHVLFFELGVEAVDLEGGKLVDLSVEDHFPGWVDTVLEEEADECIIICCISLTTCCCIVTC